MNNFIKFQFTQEDMSYYTYTVPNAKERAQAEAKIMSKLRKERK